MALDEHGAGLSIPRVLQLPDNPEALVADNPELQAFLAEQQPVDIIHPDVASRYVISAEMTDEERKLIENLGKIAATDPRALDPDWNILVKRRPPEGDDPVMVITHPFATVSHDRHYERRLIVRGNILFGASDILVSVGTRHIQVPQGVRPLRRKKPNDEWAINILNARIARIVEVA